MVICAILKNSKRGFSANEETEFVSRYFISSDFLTNATFLCFKNIPKYSFIEYDVAIPLIFIVASLLWIYFGPNTQYRYEVKGTPRRSRLLGNAEIAGSREEFSLSGQYTGIKCSPVWKLESPRAVLQSSRQELQIQRNQDDPGATGDWNITRAVIRTRKYCSRKERSPARKRLVDGIPGIRKMWSSWIRSSLPLSFSLPYFGMPSGNTYGRDERLAITALNRFTWLEKSREKEKKRGDEGKRDKGDWQTAAKKAERRSDRTGYG